MCDRRIKRACPTTLPLYQIKMKPVFLITLFAISGPVFSSQNITGEFSTVSESECNSEIHFYKDGKGVFIDSCRREDGTHIYNVEKNIFSWHIKNNKIIAKINGINETFTYHDKLSCAYFGENGSANGLIGFDLYFWRKPIICK